MKADLVQIAYEVEGLGKMVTDRAAIARHINSVHGTNYMASDIEKILMGLKPSDSISRTKAPPNRAPVTMRDSKLMAEPISWTPPITTSRKGIDPLAIATNAYLAKYGSKIRKALGA